MARTNDKIVNVDLALSTERFETIKAMVENEALTDTQKIGGVALSLLQDLADGGLMLKAEEVARIATATGLDPECGEDLIEAISAGTGREEGSLKVFILIDPSYEMAYQEIADMRGQPIQQLFQDLMDFVIAQQWVNDLPSEKQPVAVLMTPEDKAELEKLLGGKFQTGTDLAGLVKKLVADSTDLFADVPGADVEAMENML
jgi:hypothetical protein